MEEITSEFAAICQIAIKKGLLKKAVKEHCSVLPHDILYPPKEGELDFETSLIWIGIYIALFLVGMIVLFMMQGVKPSRGRNILAHIIYIIVALLVLVFHPHTFGDMVLSQFGVLVVGIGFPCFMSLKALMTPEGGDDTRWLMYWVVFSMFTLATEWIDLIAQYFTFWYELEFFILVWLQLPYTDGLSLCYEFIVIPLMKPVFAKVDYYVTNSWLLLWTIILTINISGLMLGMLVLFIMPDILTGFIIICVGLLYPVLASIIAISTTETEDDSAWLMYWVAFCLIRCAMEFADEINPWLDVPSLHRMLLVTVIWLQLPIFKGAEKIFRSILVPLAGLQADLCIVDLRKTFSVAAKLRPESLKKVADSAVQISKEVCGEVEAKDSKKKD
mmetsp:Transcript_4861/g.6407  ORF Transcript_4861/g.6407 Transcript_4861/m.6407 type:complete len:388 (+) Transcript_4861:44-1207(+)|eukprot:CAMPEP_0117755828 /NCGR_PEP_ID=MMETSP0947-20121206/13682_1 /TAXON_ID=44440 /ORGANISM="Chattonella subsalsa, Strain CCMP2191" /LENGTH=387 /DNA_ID=CAMNT_0005575233 /DNA_START=117 /DNA_END=1280 /DNA_ORIENTATION=+